jgi:hypothetical protein
VGAARSELDDGEEAPETGLLRPDEFEEKLR